MDNETDEWNYIMMHEKLTYVGGKESGNEIRGSVGLGKKSRD